MLYVCSLKKTAELTAVSIPFDCVTKIIILAKLSYFNKNNLGLQFHQCVDLGVHMSVNNFSQKALGRVFQKQSIRGLTKMLIIQFHTMDKNLSYKKNTNTYNKQVV